jgi:hypothetical protein
VDPATISVIAKAVGPINQLVKSIMDDKLAADDGEYYRRWLDVAMLAIQGLEGEYEQILELARRCDITNAEKRNDWINRSQEYINGEHLRPKLAEALGHLQAGSDILKQHADRLLIWPKIKQTREDALRQYRQHLNDLAGYLGSLGGYTGPSAVGLDEIKLLLQGASGDRDAFREFATTLQQNRDKSKLLNITQRAAATISSLRAAFRGLR